jgi:hypothetical protein
MAPLLLVLRLAEAFKELCNIYFMHFNRQQVLFKTRKTWISIKQSILKYMNNTCQYAFSIHVELPI